MKAKLVYIMEEEDVEVLRMAKNIINLLHNTETEYKNENVKKDLLKEFSDIEDMCIDGLDLDKLDSEDYDDYDEDDEDCEDEEHFVDYCEYCGCVIEEDDTHWVAANGAVCCCDECVVAYNRELGEYDDEEEDEDL
jgi:hypothetical protein